MKIQALSHHKFRALQRMIGAESTAHVAGYLELLWSHSHQAGVGPVIERDQVELICDWPGEPGALVEAMVACRWLDTNGDPSVVRIHDYEDHAPNYVKRRDAKTQWMREYRAKQESASSPRNDDGVRTQTDTDVHGHDVDGVGSCVDGVWTERGQPVDVHKESTTRRGHSVDCPTNTNPTQPIHILDTNVSKAEPVVEPSNDARKQGKLKGTQRGDWKAKASSTHLFDAFNAYPAVEWRGNPKDAQGAWDAAAKDVGGYDVLLQKVLKHLDWWDRSKVPRFTKYLEERWFNAVPESVKSSNRSKVSNHRVEGDIL